MVIKKIKGPTKKDRILVLAPHPDDESLGCFGYIHKALKSGAKVKVIVLTDGKFLSKTEQRYKETIETMEKAGLKRKNIFFLGFRDLHLKRTVYCTTVLIKIISSFKPTIIFSTSNYDFNIDHKACYYHLKKALEKIKNKPKVYYYLIHYIFFPFPRGLKPNKKIFPPLTLINSKRTWFKLELTEKETKLKKEAILNYKSQLRMLLFVTKKKLFSFIRRNELFYKENT